MKNIKIYFLFCLIFTVGLLNAQVKKYSIKKAIIASLLLPGGGEIYIKKYKTAGVLIASEITTLFAYSRMKNQEKWEENTYKQFAYVKAGIPKNSSKSKYELASQWFSSEDYNDNVRLVAHNYYGDDPELYQEFLDKYLIPDDEGWNWHSKTNWKNYRKYRENRQQYKIYANLIASGFVLNRIFSILDSVISVKRKIKIRATLNLKTKEIGVRYAFQF